MEEACIECVEAGEMTKDLAICIHGMTGVKESMYLNTQDFMTAVQQRLDHKLRN